MKLVIFDLDQTLVDFIKAHDEAVHKLFKQHFGVDVRLTDIDFAGRSLNDNFLQLARFKNIPEDSIRSKLKEMLENYDRVFIESFPQDAKKHILPGARELLEALSKTDNIIALYTGNTPDIIRKVLDSTGLGKYFRWVFAGTEVKSRADMVGQAIKKAEKLTGKRFRGKDIVVIGDSVRDVQSGKAFSAMTIAVGTPSSSRVPSLSRPA